MAFSRWSRRALRGGIIITKCVPRVMYLSTVAKSCALQSLVLVLLALSFECHAHCHAGLAEPQSQPHAVQHVNLRSSKTFIRSVSAVNGKNFPWALLAQKEEGGFRALMGGLSRLTVNTASGICVRPMAHFIFPANKPSTFPPRLSRKQSDGSRVLNDTNPLD